MAHMCTHLPADPTVVIAVMITKKNYADLYLNLPAGTHLDLETVRGGWIVVDLGECPWGWMTGEDFLNDFEPVGEVADDLQEFAVYRKRVKSKEKS